jgi:hypothetical protein
MSDKVLQLRDEAERKFLGWDTVVGVGLSELGETAALVFLIKAESIEARNRIENWAREHRVSFEVRVIGKITPLS